MTAAKILLLVYLLLKPFYLFSSGGLQFADLFLIIGFIIFLASSRLQKKNSQELRNILMKHKLFIIFVILALLINVIHFLFINEFKFLLSSLYFIFNLLAILMFSNFLKDKIFLKRVAKIFQFNLILQLTIFLTGLGRYYSADRYMGTFNDPNQFAYYILICFLFIFMINILLEKKNNIMYFFILVILTIQSGSTGMLLGVGVFSILMGAYYIKEKWISPYDTFRKIMYTLAIGFIVLIPTAYITYTEFGKDNRNFATIVEDSPITGRINEKSTKAQGDADISLLEDRGYDTITKYPHYIFFGSGEGAFKRFEKVTNNYGLEIHGTFPSILFYYGIIPFMILICWIYANLKNANQKMFVAYITLFVVSFSLINQRQALFWVLILMAGVYAEAYRKNNGDRNTQQAIGKEK